MFVVLGVTGRTGRVVASTLLAQKKAVRVVVHNDAKGEEWKARGAEVAVADVEDRVALERALRAAESAYVLLPPALSSNQVRADNNRRAQHLAAAIDSAGVGHVVLLSSIGAQHPDGTGPILALHDAEMMLGKSGGARAVTFLRPAYFMENWAMALQGVAQGVLPTFLLAGRVIPMVATRDVGLAAARLLIEGGKGRRVIQLAGPRDYSPADVAAELGRAVGKPIVAQQVPAETMESALSASGVMNAEWSRLFQELTVGINTGRVAWDEGSPLWRGESHVEAVLASFLSGAK
jgi:uncharacterized protein YbjT (DUF2867 family)